MTPHNDRRLESRKRLYLQGKEVTYFTTDVMDTHTTCSTIKNTHKLEAREKEEERKKEEKGERMGRRKGGRGRERERREGEKGEREGDKQTDRQTEILLSMYM